METTTSKMLGCQWLINDIEIPDAIDSVFSTNLIIEDSISCRIILEKDCALFEIISPKVSILPYQNKIMADVSIIMDSSNILCEGTPVNFIAAPEFNESPSNYHFQWYVNQELVVGAQTETYQNNNLNENDKVNCQLIYETSCEAGLNVSSNEIVVDFVEAMPAPLLFIESLNEIQCEGETISFQASGFDLGDFSNFLWKVDGEETYQGTPIFTLDNPSNGQVITCEATFNSLCQNDQLVLSSPIIMELDFANIPDVTIQSNITKVCLGESAQVQILNTGDTTELQYQWYVDGNNVGTNSSFLNLENIEHSTSVQCIVTINSDCPNPIDIITEQLQIEIIEPIDIEMEVFTEKPVICKGELVKIEALGKNLPDNILYHWFVDNQLIHTCETPYLFMDSISHQQKIRSEIVIPEQECVDSYILVSNSIEISVSEISLDVIELQPEICGQDGKVEIEAYDGIGNYSYQWDNGFEGNVRSNLLAGNYYLTISDELGCKITDTLSIEKSGDSIFSTIQIQDYDEEIQYGILSVETNAISPIFLWYPSNGLSCVDCPQPLVEGGYTSTYEVIVTDSRGCSTSSSFEMPIENKISPTNNIYIPNAFTPNDDGANDFFTAFGNNENASIQNLKIFSKEGILIFEKNNLALSEEVEGWNGRDFHNNIVATGVYLYSFSILIEGKLKIFSGDVTKL